MKREFQISREYEIRNIISSSFLSDLRYSSHRHFSLSLGRPRTHLYVPAPFDNLPTADESWQSGIVFEGIGARYRERYAARVPVVIK